MSIESIEQLGTRVSNLLGTAWTGLATETQAETINQALDELGFSIPLTESKKCYWLVERVKRHALYATVVIQAERFQYKQIRLQHKFEHYFKLIEKADEKFATALDEDPALFTGSNIADAFFYNPAGFVYDAIGRDLTYEYSG